MTVITSKPIAYGLDYIEAAGEASETKPTSGVATGSIIWECAADGSWKVYMFNATTGKWTDKEGNEG